MLASAPPRGPAPLRTSTAWSSTPAYGFVASHLAIATAFFATASRFRKPPHARTHPAPGERPRSIPWPCLPVAAAAPGSGSSLLRRDAASPWTGARRPPHSRIRAPPAPDPRAPPSPEKRPGRSPVTLLLAPASDPPCASLSRLRQTGYPPLPLPTGHRRLQTATAKGQPPCRPCGRTHVSTTPRLEPPAVSASHPTRAALTAWPRRRGRLPPLISAASRLRSCLPSRPPSHHGCPDSPRSLLPCLVPSLSYCSPASKSPPASGC